MDASAIGIVLLAPPVLVAEAAEVGGKALANIHTWLKTALSTIDLQTISDIPVDFPQPSSMKGVTDRRQWCWRMRGKHEQFEQRGGQRLMLYHLVNRGGAAPVRSAEAGTWSL